MQSCEGEQEYLDLDSTTEKQNVSLLYLLYRYKYTLPLVPVMQA